MHRHKTNHQHGSGRKVVDGVGGPRLLILKFVEICDEILRTSKITFNIFEQHFSMHYK